MYDIHTDRDGNSQLIAQMTDDHLIKTIALYARKIQGTIGIIQSPQVDPLLSVFQPSFSQKELSKKATDALRFAHEKIQPYVLEASLRGLNVADHLSKAYGRSEAMQGYSISMPQGESLESVLSLSAADIPF